MTEPKVPPLVVVGAVPGAIAPVEVDLVSGPGALFPPVAAPE